MKSSHTESQDGHNKFVSNLRQKVYWISESNTDWAFNIKIFLLEGAKK